MRVPLLEETAMNIAICDDEKPDLERIAAYCRRYDESHALFAFASGDDLLAAFDETFFELVFLDIEMDGSDGLTIGARLMERERKPIIIFTTQSLNYAVRGYGIALRYLPKPIEYEIFAGVMKLVTDKLRPQKISVAASGEQYLLSVDDILYFEVIRHNVIFHLRDGEEISVRASLSQIKDQLSHGCFVQTHKSYCVNMDYIDRVCRQAITMTNGESIPIGRNRSEAFQAQLQEYLKGNALL